MSSRMPSQAQLSRGPELTVSLAAVQSNWRQLSALSKGAETAAVVKADAYGLGISSIAQALTSSGCRTFFTAYTAEAIELRDALGATPTIFAFNGPSSEGDIRACNAANITPLVNSLEQAALWSQYANGAPAAVMIDTGMNRLGFRLDELGAAKEALRNCPVSWVMSHLACADEPDHFLNQQQLAAFVSLSEIWPRAKFSLSNTAGICLGRDFHFDLTRPGIGLYGGLEQGSFQPAPVASLTAPLLATYRVGEDTPQTVGYGATVELAPGSLIGVISLGYADGVHRILSNRATVECRGQFLPIAGRVSMDLIAIDLSGAEESLSPGDRVEVFGTKVSLMEQADRANTISYELLTSVGARVSRRYVEGALSPLSE